MVALIGGVGAALAFSAATLCASRSTKLVDPPRVAAWVMIVGVLLTAPEASAAGLPTLRGSVLTLFVLTGVATTAGLVVLYHALRIGHAALVAPIGSTEGAITAAISIVAGETLAPSVGVCLAVITLGVCAASIPPRKSMPRAVGAARFVHLTTIGLALTAALMFGVALYAMGRTAAHLPAAWVVMSARLGGVLVLAVPLGLRGRLRLPPGAARLVVATGVFEVIGYFAFVLSSRHGIAVAAVLSSQAATLTVLGGYVLFGERLGRVQLLGVAVTLAGVAALGALTA